MFRKLHELPKAKQHIFNILISIVCMLSAIALSSIIFYAHNENSANIALIFTLFIIIISCSTTGYLYGILCSLFSVVWFNFMYTYPYLKLNLTASGYPVTFLVMTTMAIIISTLTSHLVNQSILVTAHERKLIEAESERIRANLLRAISHDLRTPLSGIIGNSSVYCNNHATLTEQEKLDILTNIHDDATWLFNMVENLLTITRIQKDDLTIKTNVEPIEEVIGEAAMRVTKRHPGCQLQVQAPDDLIMVPMDAILIEQVIINLIENALMHSGATLPVELIVTDSPTEVSFTVRDYGHGIPKEMLDNLFEGKAYSESRNTDIQKGIGIGLVICKTIVVAHNGVIIGKNHDSGAEFTFTLPKVKEDYL